MIDKQHTRRLLREINEIIAVKQVGWYKFLELAEKSRL